MTQIIVHHLDRTLCHQQNHVKSAKEGGQRAREAKIYKLNEKRTATTEQNGIKKNEKNVNKTKERQNNDEITLNDGLHGKSLFLC